MEKAWITINLGKNPRRGGSPEIDRIDKINVTKKMVLVFRDLILLMELILIKEDTRVSIRNKIKYLII